MEKVIRACRICGALYQVPKVIHMVITFDPSCCADCNEKARKGPSPFGSLRR